MITRRTFSALALAVPLAGRAAMYPDMPIKIIVPYGAGGLNDLLGRIIATGLGARLGATVIVENRPGAQGNIGAAALATSPPDGYTLGLLGNTNAINHSFMRRPGFDFASDVVPVLEMTRASGLLVGKPSLAISTPRDFVAMSKASPRGLVVGTGASTFPMEYFKFKSGAKLELANYKSNTAAVNDFLGGHLDFVFGSPPDLIAHIAAGKMKPIFYSGKSRLEGVPAMPLLQDFYPDVSIDQWFGVFAPRSTPAPVLAQVRDALMGVRRSAEFSSFLRQRHLHEVTSTSQEFGKFVADQISGWKELSMHLPLRLE